MSDYTWLLWRQSRVFDSPLSLKGPGQMKPSEQQYQPRPWTGFLSVFTTFLLQASHLEEKIKTVRESTGSLYLPPGHQEPPTRNQRSCRADCSHRKHPPKYPGKWEGGVGGGSGFLFCMSSELTSLVISGNHGDSHPGPLNTSHHLLLNN